MKNLNLIKATFKLIAILTIAIVVINHAINTL